MSSLAGTVNTLRTLLPESKIKVSLTADAPLRNLSEPSFSAFIIRCATQLRGPFPAAIPFIRCTTCSDSIVNKFVLVFKWGIAQLSRDMRCKMGYAQVCLCETKCQEGSLTILDECCAMWGHQATQSRRFFADRRVIKCPTCHKYMGGGGI